MTITTASKNSMRSQDLELSALVGREILILSNQLKSNSLYCKVVMIHDKTISLDRGKDDTEINAIENDQEIIVQFDYKGQRVSAKASLFKTISGRSNIVLHEDVIPLNRRMFKRFDLQLNVKCAILPTQRIIESNISKLRWLQVEALNISSGGVLLPLPSKITDSTFLLLNIDFENKYLPNLIIGQVKHTSQINKFNHQVGIQFITNENKDNYFSDLVIKKIPRNALDYTTKNRNRFDKFLHENYSKTEE